MKIRNAKDADVYLVDILDSIKKIEEYTTAMTEKEFLVSSKDEDAILRRLIVIGEAANRVPKTIQKHIIISWREIVGMRNFMIHDYSSITPAVVWRTVKRDLPKLKYAIEQYRNKKLLPD